MILFRSVILRATLPRSLTVPHIYCAVIPLLRLRYSINYINGISVAHYTTNKLKTNKYRTSKEVDAYKEEMIKRMNFQSSEDAVPFYELSNKTLMHVCKVTENDKKNGFCKNRLYYLSSRINCPPSVLSAKLAKRTFIYSLSFVWLENSLNVLLDMGVAGDRILRDLWVLKYHSDTIRNRLQTVKNMGIDNFYPWMVRCTEEVMNRYVKISQETKTILAESKTTQAYLANRLNINPKDVEEMYVVLPALKTIRVTKVKHFLDFLIEAGFEVEEIASKPRVLSASQKTVEQRLQQLRALGLNDINLNVLCRSKKDFKKYVECITTSHN